jgi:hypothetical protein
MPVIGSIAGNLFSLKEVIIINLLIKVGCYLSMFFKRFQPKFYLSLIFICITAILVYPTFMLSYLLFGFAVRKLRNELGEGTDVKVKTYSRLIAFAITPLQSLLLPFFMIASACILSSYLLKESRQEFSLRFHDIQEGVKKYYSILLHHAHFVVYGLSIPFIFYDNGVDISLLGIVYALGWVLYGVYKKLTKPHWILFSIGHILCSIALILLFFLQNIYLMMFFWLLTGLGGGVFFMPYPLMGIKEIEKHLPSLIAEGIGQVLGFIIWGISLYFIPHKNVLFYGAFLGIVTAVTGLIDYRKTKHIEQVFNE